MSENPEKRPSYHCLNCRAELDPTDSFCSKCGQKVDRNKLAIKDITKEFFENYISLDSRFGRTIKPFLLKPGFLSKQFIEGKRRSFANPFRLYIISSIFFFFSLTTYLNSNTETSKPIIIIKETQLSQFAELDSSSQVTLNTILPLQARKKLNDYADSGFVKAYHNLKPLYQKQVIQHLSKKQLGEFGILADTLLLDQKLNLSMSSDEGQDMEVDISSAQLSMYKDSLHLSNKEVYDRIAGDRETSFIKEILLKRLIRISRSDETAVRKFILGNLSLAMFILIPLFAFVLKLFFLRKNSYYVAHLIHTVYLQSFAFLLFGIMLFILSIFTSLATLLTIFIAFGLLLFSIYFVKSLRRLYAQSRFTTVVKSLFLLFSYLILAMVVLLGEIFISFLTY